MSRLAQARSGLAREGAVFFGGAFGAAGLRPPCVSPFRPRDSRLRRMRFRGRNGETGLNPWRCLAKLDACGCVAHRTSDFGLITPVSDGTQEAAHCVVAHGEPWSGGRICPQKLERPPATNGRIARVPSSARPIKGCGPFRPFAEGAQRSHPRTADRTLHAPKARVSGPEQRDRGGRNPAAPEAPQSILRSERIGVVPGVRCRPASLMFVTATSRREKAGIRDNE